MRKLAQGNLQLIARIGWRFLFFDDNGDNCCERNMRSLAGSGLCGARAKWGYVSREVHVALPLLS